jgi:hypothetical protein
MSRSRLTLAAPVLLVTLLIMSRLHAGAVILDLRSDPLAGSSAPILDVQGPGSGAFSWDGGSAVSFPSDPAGSLLASYDSARPATRSVASLGDIYTEGDDFVFGAILTIRPEGFEADPFGFHPITFSLINTTTTGFNRTGSLSDFRSDAYDTIDVAYFPQVSPLFGGPWLAPAVFGSETSDDAFADFRFASVPFELTPGMPYLIVAEHTAAAPTGTGRRLIITVYTLGRGGRPVAAPGGRVEVDLTSLGGFAVNALAITAYEDGFNAFTASGRSVRADLDYDLLFFAPGSFASNESLPSLLGLIRRDGDGSDGLSR